MRTRHEDIDNTVWLTGKQEDSRLSLQYRVKRGLKYVTLGATLAFANVRTLRQNRKVGYSGSLNTKATKKNWKVPMLKHLMKRKGIYLMALQETRRTSGMKDVGDGYLLVTSQNQKYSWLGGTGFLLSPAAAEAFKATDCQTWTPSTGSAVSGRYLEIGLASAVKKEGIMTFASVYAPTAQSTMEVRTAFWDMIEGRISGREKATKPTKPANTDREQNDQRQQRPARPKRPSRRVYIAMGDWNARVGKRENLGGDPHGDVIGPHNYKSRNANGSMMLDSMARCGMKIANTYFQHDHRHTGTWKHASTGRRHVIDHVVTRGWQMRHVVDVKAQPEWNVGSDHEVCTVTLRGNPRGQQTQSSKWKTKGLTTRKGRLKVDVLVDQQFSMNTRKFPDNWTVKITQAMEDKLDRIKTMHDFDVTLREVMEAVLPKPKRRDMWDEVGRNELEAALELRGKAIEKASKDPSPTSMKARKDAEKHLRKVTRTAMYRHLANLCNDMQELADQGKGLPRDFFRELDNVKRFLGCYERPKRELVGNVKSKVKEMDTFFKKRFCQTRPMADEEEILNVPPIEGIDVDALFTEPDRGEILKAVMALKNGKTTDMIGLQAEALKAATQSPVVAEKFTDLTLATWRGEVMPKHWLQSLGVTIWKGKHPKCNLKNWRVVNLIAISSKVVSKLLHWRLQRLSSLVWSQTQYGFRMGAWTMDAVFVVTRIMEDFRTTQRVEGEGPEDVYRNTLYWMFEDYSTAFDGVPRALLWKILRKIFRIPEHIVQLIKRFHDGFKTYSVVNNMYGEGYVTLSGVRQGCVKGPDLWNFHMQTVMWALAARMIKAGAMHGVKLEYYSDGKIRARWERSIHVGQEGCVHDSTFADDSAVPADGLDNTGVFDEFFKASAAGGSVMSLDDQAKGTEGKTKAMKISGKPGDWQPTQRERDAVTAGQVKIPFVDKFIYLGCLRTTERDLGVRADMERRINKGTAVMATLAGMWRSKHITRKVKGKLMLTYAIPTALYGVSCWAQTRRTVNRLRHWWFKMAKWAFGVHGRIFHESGQTRKSLLKALGVKPIMYYVQKSVVTQIGHIARKSIENPAKQLLFGWVSGRVRRRGGQGGRRKQNPQRTLQEYYKTTLEEIPHKDFDMRIWSLLAQDRDQWRQFASSVKGTVHYGGGKKRSLAKRTKAYHAGRRKTSGEVVTTEDPTTRRPDRKRHVSVCPLRCGWRGELLPRHIIHEHPLHPVRYECMECGVTTRGRPQATEHEKSHGGTTEMKLVRGESDTYKWDHRKRFLRAIPKGTDKPRPAGWLAKTIKRATRKTGPTRVDTLWEWNGEHGEERQVREDRRNGIMENARTGDWRELPGYEKKRWLGTLAASVGWNAYEKVRTRRRADTRRRAKCSKDCRWGDHRASSKHVCPLHADYVGHLKTGGKPKGMKGDSVEADEWRRKKLDDADKKEVARATADAPGGEFCCRNVGCNECFRNKGKRLQHESGTCTYTRGGEVKPLLTCGVPGCEASHISEIWMRHHRKDCRHTFAFESPTCPSCGKQCNNKTVRNGRVEVKGKARYATAKWQQHVKKFKQTKLVGCKWCGTQHLIPGCMASPREMGREFQCSDNFLPFRDPETWLMNEKECRRRRPKEGGNPEWMGRWKTEVETLGDGNDNGGEMSGDEDEDEEDSGQQTGGWVMGGRHQHQHQPEETGGGGNEREINMLRGPDRGDATDEPQPYDEATIMLQIPLQDRRRGRRQARQEGRRRRRRTTPGGRGRGND